MELWIRSQDKRLLIKVYNVFLNANYDNKRISTYDGDSNTTLGEYKTKERALEVLDEVQEAKLGNFHYKCPSNVKVSNNEDTIVYQMPAE